MNKKEIDFNKIKDLAQQALNMLAKKASWFFLFLIILYLILGGVLIYKYSISVQKTEIWSEEKEQKKQNEFEKNDYQKILEDWKTKKIEFDKIDKKIYPNPFIEKTQQELIPQQPAEANERLPSDLPSEAQNEDENLSSVAPPPTGNETKEEPTAKSFFGKINTLFDYYISQGKNFLPISERAKIWEQEGLGETEEYHGFYNQNINLLEQLTR